MRIFSQMGALTRVGLGTIGQRFGMSFVTVIGIAAVVGVLVSFLAMGVGIREMSTRNIRDDRSVILSKGSLTAAVSSLSRGAVQQIISAPGIKKDAAGHPLVFQTVMISVTLPKPNGALVNTAITGASPNLAEVYPEFRLTEGRIFRSGLREVIVGKLAKEQFPSLTIGNTIRLRGSQWLVVGYFDANGSAWENFLMADADTVTAAFNRDSVQMLTAVLELPASFGAFKKLLSDDQTLQVDVMSEREYATMGLSDFIALLNMIGFFVGGVMAIGATCGALNTMYAAVDSRRSEIATLRAIGFSRFAVIVSVLAEAMVLALAGALLGAAAAWLLFNGNIAAAGGFSFPLSVSFGLVEMGVVWALAIGFFGALLPAIHTARMPVSMALADK